MRNQLVYDLPTRLFHWVFAGLFISAFLIVKIADDESSVFSYHMLIGMTLNFAVILRIVWAFFGTRYARLSSFSLNPRKLIEYFSDMLRAKSKRSLGHNPASSWSAVVMVILALGLGVTGYLMTSGANKETFEDVHEILGNAFAIVAILHVAGVVLHTLKHKEAIGFSMIDGKKQAVAGESPITSSRPLFGVIFLLFIAAFAGNLYRNYNPENRRLNLFGTTLQLGENENESESGEGDSEHDDD